MEARKDPARTLLIAIQPSLYDRILTTLLNNSRFILLQAIHGEATVNLFRSRNDISLLLISAGLPETDCFATITGIRLINKRVPIILLSDYMTLDTIRLAMTIGCNEIIQTPDTPEPVEAIINKYLQGESFHLPSK